MHQMEMQIKDLNSRLNGNGFNQYSTAPFKTVNDSDTSRTLPPIANGGAMQGVTYGEGRI